MKYDSTKQQRTVDAKVAKLFNFSIMHHKRIQDSFTRITVSCLESNQSSTIHNESSKVTLCTAFLESESLFPLLIIHDQTREYLCDKVLISLMLASVAPEMPSSCVYCVPKMRSPGSRKCSRNAE